MLEPLLEAYGARIARRWVELVFASSPIETRRFLESERDPFANPVGRAVREAAPVLVRALASGDAEGTVAERLGELMRIRGVQDLTAAEAVGIVPLVRRAVLDVAGSALEAMGPAAANELADRTEWLTLAAFDAFVAGRERLYEARIAERDRHRASLLARAEKVLSGMERTAGPET